MKVIEFRRHSRRGDGKGLTRAGRELARRCRRSLVPPYAMVVSSPKQRCVETAEEFGFRYFLLDARALPLDLSGLDRYDKEIRRIRKRADGLPWIGAALGHPGARRTLERLALERVEGFRAIASFIPEGARALVVTHGDLMESVALLGFPRYDWANLGRAFGHCEGFDLRFDGGRIAGTVPRYLSGGGEPREPGAGKGRTDPGAAAEAGTGEGEGKRTPA